MVTPFLFVFMFLKRQESVCTDVVLYCVAWCIYRWKSQYRSVLENGLEKYLSCPLCLFSYASCTKRWLSFWLRCAISSNLQYVYSQCLWTSCSYFHGHLKDACCHNCVTHACEAHNIRHCMIKLSSVLLDANNNNKGKVRQPVTVTLYVTAAGEEP